MNIAKRLNQDKIILICLTTFLFLYSTKSIGSINVMSIVDDEFGYWGNAAFLAGYDWSSAVSNIPYYSYGYSLLLVPLFWIFQDPTHMYKAAIAINGLLLCGSFLFCYSIAKKVIKELDAKALMVISLLIALYPSFIVYANIGWGECLLAFIIWALVWLFLTTNENPNMWKLFFIAILSVYSYTIHQRALGVLLACILTVLLLYFTKRIRVSHLMVFAITCALLFLGHMYLKAYLQNALWLNDAGNLTNDYSAQMNKIADIFTLEGMVRVFKILIGQSFYLAAASFMMFYFSVYRLTKEILHGIKQKFRRSTAPDEQLPVYVFVLIAMLFSLGISVVFMSNPVRMDHIVYGRYTDMTMGPILLFGFKELADRKTISFKRFLILTTGFVLHGTLTYMFVLSFNLDQFIFIPVIGIVLLFNKFTSIMAIIMIIWGAYLLCRSFQGSHKKLYINFFIVGFIFVFMGFLPTSWLINQNIDVYQNLSGPIEVINEQPGYPVYYLWKEQNDPEFDKWDTLDVQDRIMADFYQFLLKDRAVTLINQKQLAVLSGRKYVVTTDKSLLSYLEKGYILCDKNEYGYLFVSE